MKKSKKSRVSWPSDSMLCQVKMFLSEDCPAKVAFQSSRNPKASNMNLPPGFEATEYATRRPNISHIPRIKWKRPSKYILSDALLIASGGESTETRCENLRISKVFEAFYPHRSVIPTSPSVSQGVENESYDDKKTPNIPLTPLEDEHEAASESSHNNSKAPAAVSGLGPDLNMAVSPALSALMKTQEQGSLVDADLLVKLLSDPITIKNLMNEMAGKPLQTANITKPIVAPQHVTFSAIDRNQPPIPMTQSGIGVPHIVPVSVQSTVFVATNQPLCKPTHQPVSSALSMSLTIQKPPSGFHTCPLSSGIKPFPKLEDSYSTAPSKPITVNDGVVSHQKTVPTPQFQSQPLDISTSSTWNTNNVLESGQTGPDPQIRNGAYPMNMNRDDQVSAKPPLKNLEYYKNLIREHGVVTPTTNESNNYKGRVDNNNNNVKVVKAKFQKPCMYFGRARGCKLGESCSYLHDGSKRLWTADVPAEFPRAKRLKFGT